MGNPYASKTGSKKVAEPKSEVPAGTIKEVREWVGDDKDRAALALEEEKKNHNRKTLVDHLEEVLNG